MRKGSSWALLAGIAAVLWLFLWPQVVMLRCLSHDGPAFAALQGLRRGVSDFREKNGRLPADLAEVGVPVLELYSYDAQEDVIHPHRRISEAVSRPGAGLPGFTVHFSTRPPSGKAASALVLGDFNGFDPAKGRMRDSAGTGYTWDFDVAMSTGPHSFRFVVDGHEGPLEAVTIDHATLHPGVYATHAGLPEDAGKWIYDPETGLVVLACSGVDTKHRRPWHQY